MGCFMRHPSLVIIPMRDRISSSEDVAYISENIFTKFCSAAVFVPMCSTIHLDFGIPNIAKNVKIDHMPSNASKAAIINVDNVYKICYFRERIFTFYICGEAYRWEQI